MSYDGAFGCAKCPKNDDPEKGRACPAWWNILERNTVMDEFRSVSDCAFRLMPKFYMEMAKMNNRAAAAAIATREDILKEIGELNGNLMVTERRIADARLATARLNQRAVSLPAPSRLGAVDANLAAPGNAGDKQLTKPERTGYYRQIVDDSVSKIPERGDWFDDVRPKSE